MMTASAVSARETDQSSYSSFESESDVRKMEGDKTSTRSTKSGQGALVLEPAISACGRATLTTFGVFGGTLHLLWFNTIMNIAPFLSEAIPGYAPAAIWMTLSTVGSLIGMAIFHMRGNKEVMKLHHMMILCIVICVCGILMELAMWMVFTQVTGEAACTTLVGIFMLVAETARGYLSCLDYGVTSFFGLRANKTMSVAMSCGEAIVGCIPWLILIIISMGSELDTLDANFHAVSITMLCSIVITLFYLASWAFLFHYKGNAILRQMFDSEKDRRKKMIALEIEANGGKPRKVLEQLRVAVKPTVFNGVTIIILMTGCLNVFPQVFPFGYNVTVEQTQYLLGIFTLCDPIFRVAGFSFNAILKDRKIPRVALMIAVIVRAVSFWPFLILPYYWPENDFLNSFSQYMWEMLSFGVTQGLFTIACVHCFMSHIPDSSTKELSCSLVAVYFATGCLCGQITYFIYPAIMSWTDNVSFEAELL